MSARLPRIALVALALCACAWFAIELRDFHHENYVKNYLSAHPRFGDAQAQALDAQLDDAGTLNPDRELDLLRAYVEVHAQHLRRAIAIAQAAARAESQNIANWFVVQFIAGQLDPAAYRLATQRIDQLAPPVPAAR